MRVVILGAGFGGLELATRLSEESDGAIDVVYVNSLDHAYDLDRVLGEVARVLVPGGVLWAEIGMG